jgi:hypothetical protein
VAYGFAYLFSVAKYDPPPFPVPVNFLLGQFGTLIAFSIVGIVPLLIRDAREEIGWRGYMLPHMIDASLSQPVMLSALVCDVWYLPIMFAGVYEVTLVIAAPLLRRT